VSPFSPAAIAKFTKKFPLVLILYHLPENLGPVGVALDIVTFGLNKDNKLCML
jgi:hypothetical protein